MGFLRDEDGEIITDVDGNPVLEERYSPIFQALRMLNWAGYSRIALLFPFDRDTRPLLAELQALEIDFKWNRASRKLQLGGMIVYIYTYNDDPQAYKLRGANFEAAIVQGRPSDTYRDMLRFSLRLGTSPMTIYV